VCVLPLARTLRGWMICHGQWHLPEGFLRELGRFVGMFVCPSGKFLSDVILTPFLPVIRDPVFIGRVGVEFSRQGVPGVMYHCDSPFGCEAAARYSMILRNCPAN
jgi:hypothetical protein